MAKRWRDEVTASTRGGLLKRRNRTDPTTETEGPERRRRIAGERPGAKPEDGADLSEASDETDTAAVPVTAAPGDPKDAKDAKSSESESQALAKESARKAPRRVRVLSAIAAAVVGIVVGALLTGLVYAGMQAFEAIYNTPAGDGAGAVVLVLVLIVSALAGRHLLKWRGLPDPNATTLLGIMLMAIVTLAALLPIVFSVWMVAITPALGGVCYLVSHLLIAHFGDHS